MLGLHIHSICDALDIPHLETRPDLDLLVLDNGSDSDGIATSAADNDDDEDDITSMAGGAPPPGDIYSTLLSSRAGAGIAIGNFHHQRRRRRRFAINLHPAQHLINAALLDVVNYLNWTRVAIVFEGNDGGCTRIIDQSINHDWPINLHP